MDKIDWKFIRTLEGFELEGYIPKDRDKNDRTPSGVTVASGVDLGQMTYEELVALTLPHALTAKLTPYVRLTSDDARAMLRRIPLKLTQDEADILDKRVKLRKTNAIRHLYDKATTVGAFDSLTSAQQTVIISVAFQYGDISKRCPKFFKACTTMDWKAVVKELENFGDGYGVRRRKEAKLLRKELGDDEVATG